MVSITSQALHIIHNQMDWLESLSKLSKTCSIRQEEGKDMCKSLMIYPNTPLSSSLQSPMQILQSRFARSDFSMSNAARKQLGLDP